VRKLTPDTRRALKRPLGKVFAGMREALLQVAGKHVVSVGDFCSYKLLRAGTRPDVVVYDHSCLRKPVSASVRNVLDGCGYRLVRAKNPPGTITAALVRAVRGALAHPKARVLVEGEEDLAALVALTYAKEGTVVAYGQPRKGVVLVEVGVRSRAKARRIYGKMKKCRA
jgi:uncharacterized protein (UPF0218 family)